MNLLLDLRGHRRLRGGGGGGGGGAAREGFLFFLLGEGGVRIWSLT